jgi:hypothetical protein
MGGSTRALALVAALAVTAAPAAAHDGGGMVIAAGWAPSGGHPERTGVFSNPFAEPTIDGRRTDAKCIENGGDASPLSDARHLSCKPAGVSVNVLPDRKVMYYDGLEGTENVRTSIVAEYGHNAGNDQSRLLDPNAPSWSVPQPSDGGANPKG